MVSVRPPGFTTTNSTAKGAVPTVAVKETDPASYTHIAAALAIMPATGVGFTVMVTTLEVALHCGVVSTLR